MKMGLSPTEPAALDLGQEVMVYFRRMHAEGGKLSLGRSYGFGRARVDLQS